MGARKPKNAPDEPAVIDVEATPAPDAAPSASPAPQAAAPGASAKPAGAAASAGGSLDLVLDVPVRVTVEVGSTRLLVREVLQFEKGSVVELDRQSGEPADILVNGRVLARGEVTVVDDRLAVRVIEVVARPGAGPGS